MKGFFVTGTDTEVGKTEVSNYLAKNFFKQGFKVGIMKPIAAGRIEDYEMDYVNPISLRLPLAPIVAARIENKKIDLDIVWDSFRALQKQNDIIIVEGIGGVMVPICKIGKKTFYVRDMILKMELPVIIVTRPNLGTINHTLQTVNILKKEDIQIAGIVFNYTTPIKNDISVRTNPEIIEELSGVGVLGIMYYNKDRNKRRIKCSNKNFLQLV